MRDVGFIVVFVKELKHGFVCKRIWLKVLDWIHRQIDFKYM